MKLRIFNILSLTLLIFVFACNNTRLSDEEIENKASAITKKLNEENIDIFRKWNFGLRGQAEIWTKTVKDSTLYSCMYFKSTDTVSIVAFNSFIYSHDFPLKIELDTSMYWRFEFKKSLDQKIEIVGIDHSGNDIVIKSNLTENGIFENKSPFEKMDSLSTLKDELGRPSDNLIQAARFRNVRDLKLLDLTSDGYYRKQPMIFGESSVSEYNMIIWPLIAACSVKVPDKNVAFKPEYIIPQLLLQWINKNELDGIKYSSTHINQRKNKHIGKLYNIVIPVRSFKQKEGYCKELLNTFEVSNVMPMQLNQFSSNPKKNNTVQSELRAIELIKGKTINYSDTIFGKMEHQLIRLPLAKIPVANNGYK